MSLSSPRRPLACLLVPLLLAAGCAKEVPPKVEPPRPVRTMTVAPVAGADTLEFPAEVRPRYETRYGFRIGGKIATRSVALGQTVTAGQELARLDLADVQPAVNAQTAQLEAARTEVALQAAELKRTRELRDRNFISQAQVDRVKAAHDAAVARENAARAQLQQARNAVEFTTLRADRAGVVTGVDAEAGQVVATGQSVVRVAQLGEKEVVVNVPEQDVERFRRARSLAVTASALPGRRYVGVLRELSPLADPASRTFLARVTVKDADAALQLGMSATLLASAGAGARIVVPLSALRATGERTDVWVVDTATQTVKPRPVTLGAPVPGGVEILSGLERGDVVVTAGANLLLDGQKVRLGAPMPAARGEG